MASPLRLEWLSSPTSQRLALVLLHFLWQGFLVAGVAALLSSTRTSRRASLGYATHLLAFLTMAACPVVTFVVIERPSPSPSEVLVDGTAGASPAGSVEVASQFPTPFATSPSLLTAGRLNAFYPWVVLVWLSGALTLSLRLWGGLLGLRRYRRQLIPLPESLAGRVDSICRRLKVTRFGGVFGSDRLCGAIAIGFLHPLVVLPSPWLAQLPPEVFEAVIAHELAHIRRGDLWVIPLQRIVETLLFYHPAVWLLSRRISFERELCCDEMAARALRKPVAYASALEIVARRTRLARSAALAAGIGSRAALLRRVRHVLGLGPTRESRCWWFWALFTLAIPLALATTTVSSSFPSAGKPERLELIDGLGRIERNLHQLRDEVDRLVASGALRIVDADFDGPKGHLYADNYFELGRFKTAVRGYRAVLSRQTEHRNALEILQRIREAHRRAGHLEEAIEVQRRIVAEYARDDPYRALRTLASLEKQAGRYADAVRHAEQALDAASNWEEKLVGLNFRAWYIELEEGPEAGLLAYRDVERLAASMGALNSNPGRKTRSKIERLERILRKRAG